MRLPRDIPRQHQVDVRLQHENLQEDDLLRRAGGDVLPEFGALHLDRLRLIGQVADAAGEIGGLARDHGRAARERIEPGLEEPDGADPAQHDEHVQPDERRDPRLEHRLRRRLLPRQLQRARDRDRRRSLFGRHHGVPPWREPSNRRSLRTLPTKKRSCPQA